MELEKRVAALEREAAPGWVVIDGEPTAEQQAVIDVASKVVSINGPDGKPLFILYCRRRR